ncbi:MAG: hypothetical protein WB785_21430 [Mycobacterium sp.]|uniref:hypothetical protein n=1 Tax=Mycobacterium sp. TaxID=1785 RepID=UPI003C54A052
MPTGRFPLDLVAGVGPAEHRDATGWGSRIVLPPENVALATAGNLGFLTAAVVNNTHRERLANSNYCQYAEGSRSIDGATFMVVTLTVGTSASLLR